MPNYAAASHSKRRLNLPPTPPQLRNISPIAPQCTASRPTTLVFREKKAGTRGGEDGRVRDAAGTAAFEIAAPRLSLSGRRVLKDARGTELGEVRRKKTPSEYETWFLGTPDDRDKCTVKCKGIDATRCAAEICLASATIGEARGNWREKAFGIAIFGKPVAKVSREAPPSAPDLVLDDGCYCIEISSGVDSAFITLIIMALDEIYRKYG